MSNRRKRLVGQVVKSGLEKTVTVRVDRTHRHPLYQKVMRSKKRYLVHDEQGCQVGDRVKIVESRPISKRKRWTVEQIIQKAEIAA